MNLSNFECSKLNELKQILKGLYGMQSDFDHLYLYRELRFRGNFWEEGIFWNPL